MDRFSSYDDDADRDYIAGQNQFPDWQPEPQPGRIVPLPPGWALRTQTRQPHGRLKATEKLPPRQIALELLEARPAQLLYSAGHLYEWTGKIYQLVDNDQIEHEIYVALGDKFRRALVNEVRRAIELQVLDKDERIGRPHLNLIALNNGMLDTRTGELLPHDPGYGTTNLIPIEYDKNAGCPTFEKCLEQWLPDDPEARELLIEFMGYCLTPDTSLEKALVLIGEGGNGKGRFINVLQKLVGPANDATIPLPALRAERTFPSAHLMNKLLNVCPEWETRTQVDEGWLKSLISGDKVGVERKMRDPFEFYPAAKFVIQCNNPPYLTDKSNGIWRRLMVVRFRSTFSDETADTKLDSKLEAELSGILNLALMGLARLRERGMFIISEPMKQESKTYKDECNPIQQWINECTEPGGSVSSRDAFKEYMAWCKESNHAPASQTKFSRDVHRAKNSDGGRIDLNDVWHRNSAFVGDGSPTKDESKTAKNGRNEKTFMGIHLPNHIIGIQNDESMSGGEFRDPWHVSR